MPGVSMLNCAVSGDSGDPMCRVSYAHARASLSDKRHHLKRAVRQAYAKYIGSLTRDIIVSGSVGRISGDMLSV